MATGHILPGYRDSVSKLCRSRSAGYPLNRQTLLDIQQSAKLPLDDLDSIRTRARELWCCSQIQETSYGQDFAQCPADERMHLRPTSPTRRNNPHPSLVFLTNRLHYIPGYHTPDTTKCKEVYQVDASLPTKQQEEREAARRKHTSRPNTASLQQYSDPYGLRRRLGSRAAEAQAGEGWLALADDADKDKVLQVLQKEREKGATSKQGLKQVCDSSSRPKTAYPSTYRWMKYAGAQEAGAMAGIARTPASGPDRQAPVTSPRPAGPVHSVLSMRRHDIFSASKTCFHSKLSRGDFLIHPDWPPSLPHHKVGFSK